MLSLDKNIIIFIPISLFLNVIIRIENRFYFRLRYDSSPCEIFIFSDIQHARSCEVSIVMGIDENIFCCVASFELLLFLNLRMTFLKIINVLLSFEVLSILVFSFFVEIRRFPQLDKK